MTNQIDEISSAIGNLTGIVREVNKKIDEMKSDNKLLRDEMFTIKFNQKVLDERIGKMTLVEESVKAIFKDHEATKSRVQTLERNKKTLIGAAVAIWSAVLYFSQELIQILAGKIWH